MANPLPKKNRNERKQSAPTPPAAEKKTYVALVLDSSGSMQMVRDDAIGGFNTNVSEIQKNADLGGQTLVSLFTFGEMPDSLPKIKFLNQPPASLVPLTRETYKPSGNTPMLDAIGLALTSLESFDAAAEDVAFLVTVITDGAENASREWQGPDLSSRIKALEAKGNWTITLIGANVDLDAIHRQTGIRQTVGYTSTRLGTQVAMGAQASASSSYFAARAAGVSAVPDMYAGEANLSDAGAAIKLQVRADLAVKKARRRRGPHTPSVV